MNVIGIDPGKDGALALVSDGRLVALHAMPCVEVATKKTRLEFGPGGKVERSLVTHRAVDPAGVLALMQALSRAPCSDTAVLVALERVGGMPGQAGMFSFGRSFGVVETAAHALGLPLRLVEPVSWKAAMGCTKDKATARARASEAFPAFAAAFGKAKDADKAEAALIALYAYGKARS